MLADGPPLPSADHRPPAFLAESRQPIAESFALQTHVGDGVAPIAVTGGAADGADFNDVGGAGRQAGERQIAGAGEQAAVLPRAGRAAGADDGIPDFIRMGIGDGLDAGDQLTGVAIDQVLNDRLRQRGLGVVGAGGLIPAGEQRGQIIVALGLDIEGVLPEGIHQHGPHIVLGGSRGRAALGLRGDGVVECGRLRRHQRQSHGRIGKREVPSHVGTHRPGKLIKGGVGVADKV